MELIEETKHLEDSITLPLSITQYERIQEFLDENKEQFEDPAKGDSRIGEITYQFGEAAGLVSLYNKNKPEIKIGRGVPYEIIDKIVKKRGIN